MKKILALSLGIVLMASSIWGATLISLPNTYTTGTKIQASQANANEQHIQTVVNGNMPTGDVVGTTDPQTLSGPKTLVSPILTTAPSITGDTTFSTGIKAIFGNSDRYILDDTSAYAIEFSTHIAIPAASRLYLDGGATSNASYITETSGDIIDIFNGGTASARFSPAAAGNYALNLYNEGGALTQHGLAINAGDDGGGITCNFIQFLRPDATQCGVIRKDGAAAVAYITTSDVRAKENIKNTKYSITDLMKVKVRDFNFKGYGKSYTGFVAQELNEVFPEAVSKPSDPKDMWGIDYGKITPLLIKAIQDQQVIINDLKKRIEKLEAK